MTHEINLPLLRQRVEEAWKNACEGGYDTELRQAGFEVAARDMIAYDDEICELAPGDPDSQTGQDYDALIPHIIAILKEIA